MMSCPYCDHPDTQVIDSRASESLVIRRRRVCKGCSERFTTYERIEEMRRDEKTESELLEEYIEILNTDGIDSDKETAFRRKHYWNKYLIGLVNSAKQVKRALDRA